MSLLPSCCVMPVSPQHQWLGRYPSDSDLKHQYRICRRSKNLHPSAPHQGQQRGQSQELQHDHARHTCSAALPVVNGNEPITSPLVDAAASPACSLADEDAGSHTDAAPGAAGLSTGEIRGCSAGLVSGTSMKNYIPFIAIHAYSAYRDVI